MQVSAAVRRSLVIASLLAIAGGCASREEAKLEQRSVAPAAVVTTETGTLEVPAWDDLMHSVTPMRHDDDGRLVATTPYAIVDGVRVDPPVIPMGDPATIKRLLTLGKTDNHVMDHLTHLTQRIGPRLTGSSNAEAANNWTRQQFESWGLANAHLWEWGTIAARFDRGPSTGNVYDARPQSAQRPGRMPGAPGGQRGPIRELQFSTLAWTNGTQGPVRGRAVTMPATLDDANANFESYKGAWIIQTPRGRSGGGIRAQRDGATIRFNRRAEARDRLAKGEWPSLDPVPTEPIPGLSGDWTGPVTVMAQPGDFALTLTETDGQVGGKASSFGAESPITNVKVEGDTLTFNWNANGMDFAFSMKRAGETLTGGTTYMDEPVTMTLTRKLPPDTPTAPDPGNLSDYILQKVLEAGPAGFLSSSEDERVWTSSVNEWRTREAAAYPADVEVTMTGPDYDFINSRLADGMALDLEFDLNHVITPGPIACYDTIAEIPGSDPVLKNEVVIVSAHLDSWNGPGSQGCVDNGTGSSVVLETARLLMAAGAKPKRTIRFVLWTGEEQGLLGSAAYAEHLGDELSRVSAVFVDDGGTNYEGGLEAIGPMRDYLAAATAPVNGQFFDASENKWMNVNVRIGERMPRGGGSDHASFNRRGVPGFFWDEVGRADYQHGWHTQFDRLDQAIPEYLQQSSTCMAITAYNLACAPDMLPRQVAEPAPTASAN